MGYLTFSIPLAGARGKTADKDDGTEGILAFLQPKLHTVRVLQRLVSGRKFSGAKFGWSVSAHTVRLAVLLFMSASLLAWLNSGYKSTPVKLFRASYGSIDWRRGDNSEWGAGSGGEGITVLPAVMTAECASKRTLSACGQMDGIVIATVRASHAFRAEDAP